MKKPSISQVAAEIKKLRDVSTRIERYSAFGNDHLEAIDAQVEVLEKEMSEGIIWDRFSNEEDDEATVLNDALSARRWLDGKEKESPSKGWDEICPPKP